MESRGAFAIGNILQKVLAFPIRVLRPLVTVRLVRFHTPYGFMLRCPLYYSLRRLEEETGDRRYFDVVFWSGPTPDPEYSQFWRRQIPLLPEFLHRILWKPLHVIAWYWQRNSNMQEHVFDLALGKNHVSSSMNSNGYHAASFIEQQDHLKLQSCLQSLGVAANSRIALIHVRNSSHDIQTGGGDDYDVNFVNASPQNFQAAVDHLIAEGFAVLTVGNHPASASGLERVIEYHSAPQRTSLLDFMIGNNAHLFLGTTAGALSGVAFNFRLPSLLTNHVIWNSEITAEPFSYGRAVFLLKGVSRDGSQLSQSEVMRSHLPSSDRALREMGVSLQENSSAEILEGLKELLALGEVDDLWNQERRGVDQGAFWQVFDSHTRLERVCKDDGALISPSFLRANPHWLR